MFAAVWPRHSDDSFLKRGYMYQKTFVLRGINDLNDIINSKKLRNLFAGYFNTYVQIYTTRIHHEDIGDILDVLKDSFPGIKMAGMSLFGIGEFNNQYTAILSFMFFKRSETQTISRQRCR